MSTVAATTTGRDVGRPTANPWIIGVVVSMAAFMEVLDSSIANVALPHIAGNLGASNDESTWVLTSYLAANAIVLPITGWLTEVFGRKAFFMLCIAVFTASSFCCGGAPTLSLLLLFRAIQGAFGGGLQPMAQAILLDTFPRERRGLALALYGVTAVCGPAIGPTAGGWITDSYSWRWIFYINVPVGVLALFLTYQLVQDPPSSAKRAVDLSRFDYIGFSLLAVGVAALQIVLDKGQDDDWLSSHLILSLSIIAVACLTALIIWEWIHDSPIVDVRLFGNMNFAASNLMMFIVGIVLYATAVLMPQMLQTLMGYTAELAGFVLSGGALVLLVSLPMVGRLTGKFAAKYLIALGWLGMSVAMFFSIKGTDLQISFLRATILRVYQVIPNGLLFIPITLVAYVGLSAENSNAAAGLVNFMRNMGGSVGTSIVSTVVARRSQFHQSILAQHTHSLRFESVTSALATRLSHAGIDSVDAHSNATARLGTMLLAQAGVLSYIDLYWIFAVASIVMFILSFFLTENDPTAERKPPAD